MTAISDKNEGQKLIMGIVWMVGSLASFIGIAVASRELSQSMSVFQILFFRSLVGVGILLLFIRTLLPELRQAKRFKMHFSRNVVHFGAQCCWTVGIAVLPLSEVFALEFTMPVWAALFAFLFLGERISKARMVAVLMSFVGILVILRPGFEIIDPASFVVLIAAIGFGVSVIMVKLLTRDCSPAVIVVWMILLQLPMGLVFALPDWQPTSLEHLPWIILAGITGMSAHYTMAKALRLVDASIAIPIDFFRVPLIALVGFYLYGETIEIWLLLGAFLIFGSNYYALRQEARKTRP